MNSRQGRVKLPTKQVVTRFGRQNCSGSTGTPACALLHAVMSGERQAVAKLLPIEITTKSPERLRK